MILDEYLHNNEILSYFYFQDLKKHLNPELNQTFSKMIFILISLYKIQI